jgi:hypothetical protein
MKHPTPAADQHNAYEHRHGAQQKAHLDWLIE